MAENKISAVILTHNNAASMRRCLESLSWCDEICVIDDYSTDNTLGISSERGAKIFHRKLDDNFSEQRNFAFGITKNEWLFFVDADEIVNSDLATEIMKKIPLNKYEGFRIPRATVFLGRKLRYGEFLGFSLVRLGKKNAGVWKGRVHEKWEIQGKIGVLSCPLTHEQVGGEEELLRKINKYSSLRAAELYQQKISSGFLTILLYPLAKFIINYLLKLGFLDGIAGIVNAFAMSFYTFLVRAKLWLLWNETTKKV